MEAGRGLTRISDFHLRPALQLAFHQNGVKCQENSRDGVGAAQRPIQVINEWSRSNHSSSSVSIELNISRSN